MNMGQKIYQLRKEKGMTLEELGNKVGVGKSTVRKWENGIIANMKRDKIIKVAEALGTTPSYLMGWEEEHESYDEKNKNKVDFENIDGIYLSYAKEAQENGIDPNDIRLALDTIKKIREESR